MTAVAVVSPVQPINFLTWLRKPERDGDSRQAMQVLFLGIKICNNLPCTKYIIPLDFIRHNSGCFLLISDKEIYELRSGKESFDTLDLPFPGTIVTITINLKDTQLYFLNQSNNDIIIF